VLNGVKIAEGDLLQLLYGSANHDEAKWEDPEKFSPYLDRRGTALMSLSRGIHHCGGAPLARTETRKALEVPSRRLPGLRLSAQEFQYLRMVMVDGLQLLKVEW
jgi:cytochrome P450